MKKEGKPVRNILVAYDFDSHGAPAGVAPTPVLKKYAIEFQVSPFVPVDFLERRGFRTCGNLSILKPRELAYNL